MSKYVDAIIGHAIGDAMGMPTEFCIREHLLSNLVTDMIGSKKVGQPAGTWTDDTSMEIATIESIISNKGFNYSDIMTRWCDWLNKGDYTPNGEVFDVGRTCLRACRNFMNGIEPTKCGLSDENSNGNAEITLDSFSKKFPLWMDMWKKSSESNNNKKYTYIYMGFGNGLSIDNNIYEEYKQYFLDEVNKIKESHGDSGNNPSFNYPAWEPAFIKMCQVKNYKINQSED